MSRQRVGPVELRVGDVRGYRHAGGLQHRQYVRGRKSDSRHRVSLRDSTKLAGAADEAAPSRLPVAHLEPRVRGEENLQEG